MRGEQERRMQELSTLLASLSDEEIAQANGGLIALCELRGTERVHQARPATGKAANSQSNIQGDGSGGDDLDGGPDFIAQPHNRALPELLVDLSESKVERLLPVRS